MNKPLDAALQTIRAVADAIQELDRVPSGHLYAQLMGHMDIHTYNSVIACLKGAGLIEEKNHELIWTGPAKEHK